MKFIISKDYDCYDTERHEKFSLRVGQNVCKALDIIGFVNVHDFQIPTERDLLFCKTIEPVKGAVKKVPYWFRHDLCKATGVSKSAEFDAENSNYYVGSLMRHHLSDFTSTSRCFVGTMLDFIINSDTYIKSGNNKFPVRAYYANSYYTYAGARIRGRYLYIVSCEFSNVCSEKVTCAVNKFKIIDRSLFDDIVCNSDSCHDEEIRKIIGKASILLSKGADKCG